MHNKIIEIIAEIKEDAALIKTLDTTSGIMNEAGLDSLQIINFILRIEEEFGVEVDFDTFDLEHLSSIDAFVVYLGQLVRV
ncbi:acyl carrier protein [Paenibacillus prosopidis]|uniref:Phosphopantetheine binding protein n=1 Tax=Paenibacillus prosopidis TaxID=630520 RepID=A0A368VRJ8_9BACL|nr:acyl carrier protein [Paenibacillus prosopidis]RCW43482.1 phosphopantetheine binding protein [Paenibacillus prosopidis]